MLHKTLEAKATVTDQGEFTAIAAAYTLDRGKERIIPGAFAKTIESWQASGKQIPLHWDHQGEAHNIIGTVDPAQMKETDAGLFVAGKLDLANSEVAQQAWRTIKSGAMGLSFGYLVTKGAEAKDAYELYEVDLFEISVTPAPMNADTRFLSLKSVTQMTTREMVDEINALSERINEMRKALADQDVSPPTEVEGARDQDDESSRQASDPEEVDAELERFLPFLATKE